MGNLEKVLDYFIEYEGNVLLDNIEIKKDSGYINLLKDDLENIKFIENALWDKKKEKICEVLAKVQWKKIEKHKEVEECIPRIIDGTIKLQDILKQDDYKYANNYYDDIKNISKIIDDNQLFILYPILKVKEKKIPLVSFIMKIKEDKIIVNEYKVQIDAFRIVCANIMDCPVSEVELTMPDFNALFNTISDYEREDLFEIIDIIENELQNKFVEYHTGDMANWNDYNNLAVTKEIILTMDSFGEMKIAPYLDEIKLVKELSTEKESNLLNRYLLGGKEGKSVEKIGTGFNQGSYSGEFPINKKQAKVVSAYTQSQLLAVNGPPGTGKTTVLKEIIADNIVKKAKKLIDVWDTDWSVLGEGRKQEVYLSPLNGQCDYSMVIASGNNKAVNNIGVELLKEIPYFKDLLKESEYGYQGILCARLGKKENMNEFHVAILNPLIKYLKNYDVDEEEKAKECIAEFNELNNKLTTYKQKNENYCKKRNEILMKLAETGLFANQITENEIEKVLEELKNKKNETIETTEEIKKIQNKVDQDINQRNKDINEIQDNIIKYTCIKNDSEDKWNKISQKRKVIFIGKWLANSLARKYGTIAELEQTITVNTDSLEREKSEKIRNEEIYNNLKNEYESLNAKICECKKALEFLNHQLESVSLYKVLKELLLELNKLYSDELKFDIDEYSLNYHTDIVKMRNRAFVLALRLNEYYIKKHAKEISYNLEKVYPDKWFQPFYRSDYKYDQKYQKYMKAQWETIFLCFPIVTTTLHSFDMKKFPMICELYDTLLIDEAGQALIDTVVGPLYRFRKAVIVGDVYQLEPIRKTKQKLLEGYDISEELKEKINIDENSVQHAADRNSEVFDKIAGNKVGIILNEHRRCEESIVQFSNVHVYDNALTIIKKDKPKEFLKSNLCMLDIRGSKTSRNVNDSEVKICKRIVEELLMIHGEEYKSKIGIITPYYNQSNRIKSEIPGVDAGTVHVFQGQEKEVIIMSMVVDNTVKNDGTYFVGNNPNFLNVAFTRAKSQLILVGNYETCKASSNYLKKAVSIVEQRGLIYTLYDQDLLEKQGIEEKYLKQFYGIVACKIGLDKYSYILNESSIGGIISTAQGHKKIFDQVLLNAEESIRIVSPWICASVVNDEFLSKISKLLQAKKEVTIRFGYRDSNFTLNDIASIIETDNLRNSAEADKKALDNLYALLEDRLKYTPPLHSKILIMDDKIMIIGSFNWLSNSGTEKVTRDEVSCITNDEQAINFVKERYFKKAEEK
ncbi:DNA helicase [Lachnospiraceae bacterium KM106-2]|nr:DNA helicase [Lachnospiraceae bacterium KM106-2]